MKTSLQKILQPFQNEFADMHWIIGSEYSAARKKSGSFWAIIPKTTSPKTSRKQSPDWFPSRNLILGLNYQLNRSTHDLSRDPMITRSPNVLSFPSLPLPRSFAILIITILGAFSTAGLFLNTPTLNIFTPLRGLGELFILIAVSVASYLLCFLWEAGILSNALHSSAYLLGIGWLGPIVEPVAWKLGIFGKEAVLSILFPLILSFAAWSWAPFIGIFSAGILLGSWLYLIFALYPLREGPGSELLEAISDTENLPDLLKWSLSGHFLPAGQRVEKKGRNLILATMVLATMAWVSFSGFSFKFFSSHITATSNQFVENSVVEQPILQFNNSLKSVLENPHNRDIADWMSVLLSATFNLAGALFCLWVLLQLALIYRNALRLRGKGQASSIEPSLDDIEVWVSRSALLRHVPAFLGIQWEWLLAPPGTLLYKYGELGDRFLWLVSGEAMILGRNEKNDLFYEGMRTTGAGIGSKYLSKEINAQEDILTSQTSIIAVLQKDSFKQVDSPETRKQLAQVISTNKIMLESGVFKGIPAEQLELWITRGVPFECKATECIVQKGSSNRNMGLLVSGRAEIKRDNKLVAILEPGDVFGDTSFLHEENRSVDITCSEDSLFWIWNERWMKNSIDGLGLEQVIRASWQFRK